MSTNDEKELKTPLNAQSVELTDIEQSPILDQSLDQPKKEKLSNFLFYPKIILNQNLLHLIRIVLYSQQIDIVQQMELFLPIIVLVFDMTLLNFLVHRRITRIEL